MTPLSWPPVLIDEDFPAPVAHALTEYGLSVSLVAGSPLSSAGDAEVLAHAAAVGRVLVSHNQRDRARFREYVRSSRRRGNSTVCALFLPRDLDDRRLRLRTMLLLAWYASLPTPKPETLIWNDMAQAIIHGYQPSGFNTDEIAFALGQVSPA